MFAFSLTIISNSVAEMGKEYLFKCPSLLSVIIPDLTAKIEDRCFYGCSSLSSLIIQNSINILERKGF
jgi:hypothetical protein